MLDTKARDTSTGVPTGIHMSLEIVEGLRRLVRVQNVVPRLEALTVGSCQAIPIMMRLIAWQENWEAHGFEQALWDARQVQPIVAAVVCLHTF